MAEIEMVDTLAPRIIGAGVGWLFGGPLGGFVGGMAGEALARKAFKHTSPPATVTPEKLAERRALAEKYRDNPEFFSSGHG